MHLFAPNPQLWLRLTVDSGVLKAGGGGGDWGEQARNTALTAAVSQFLCQGFASEDQGQRGIKMDKISRDHLTTGHWGQMNPKVPVKSGWVLNCMSATNITRMLNWLNLKQSLLRVDRLQSLNWHRALTTNRIPREALKEQNKIAIM